MITGAFPASVVQTPGKPEPFPAHASGSFQPWTTKLGLHELRRLTTGEPGS